MKTSWGPSVAIGCALGAICAVTSLSPATVRGHTSLTTPSVAYAAGSCTRIGAAFTGSETSPSLTIGGLSGTIGVSTPSFTCDQFEDTWYWVGIETPLGSCPSPGFAQVGWAMVNVPTNFYEEFNQNSSCPSAGAMFVGAAAAPSSSYKVTVGVYNSFYCSGRGITHYYVNGTEEASVCSDWNRGSEAILSTERQEATSHLANTTFSNAQYCNGDGVTGDECAPNTALAVTGTNSVPGPDPCGVYTRLSTTSFKVSDKRDSGGTC